MTVFVKAWSAWSPGIETKEAWEAFARGEIELQDSSLHPELPFAPTMFKRRLSQLSRMAIQTGYEVLGKNTQIKITFASVYGEIAQQLHIALKLIETHQVSPAAFSLSVFNTPVAALSILTKNKAGYTAIFPGETAFRDGLIETVSAIKSKSDEERVLIYADEYIPEEYRKIATAKTMPFALAMRLSKKREGDAIELSNDINSYASPLEFIKKCLLKK